MHWHTQHHSYDLRTGIRFVVATDDIDSDTPWFWVAIDPRTNLAIQCVRNFETSHDARDAAEEWFKHYQVKR